ncbi:MAG TPA: 3-phosphoshikimate 1-carboxyvinyltransferase [Pilimelia sp.]|nr:3-phosphoshikimate 1-carboxyvinyltransferase [Pilimelia sp.]
MTAGSLPPAVLKLRGPCQVRGIPRVPGDKSISHRALLLTGQATGTSTVTGLSQGDDVARTRRAMEQLGARIEESAGGALLVTGGDPAEPSGSLDHGNSGTGIRLMAGVVAGCDLFAVLTGDEFLRRRPMDRIAAPLRAMGAVIDGRRNGSLAPLAIRGGHLRGIRYASPVASAQVKSAILLAGLRATGITTVVEPIPTRRHTEEMLLSFGAEVSVEGAEVRVAPSRLQATDVAVPGDPSQAAFWVVAGLVVPDSEITVADLYLGPGRAGFVDVLRHMGADVDVDAASGAVRSRHGPLTGVTIDSAGLSSFIDEVPILAVAAAAATGRTVLSGASELRVKESDRITTVASMLKAFGGTVAETTDGMVIEGGARLHGADIDSHGDHRVAMAAAIAALRAEGETTVRGWESVSTSYPGFAEQLNELTNGAAEADVIPASD